MSPFALVGALCVSGQAANAQEQSEEAHSKEVEVGRSSADVANDFLSGVKISGLGQVDYLRLDRSSDELGDGNGEALNEDRFTVARARVAFEREWQYVGIHSQTELFADGGAQPVAFDVEAMLPGSQEGGAPRLWLKAGLLPVPFGYENYSQTDGQRFFGERTLFSHAFVPGRFDLGAALGGNLYGVEWVVAAQNGEPRSSGRFSGRDPNAAKDFSGRVRSEGRISEKIGIALSASLLYGTGFSAGTPPTKDSFEWRDLNEDGRVLVSELIPIPGSAGRASQNFNRWGLGSDIQIWTEIPVLGELMVYGEIATAVNLDRAVAPADPVLLGRDQRSLGYYLAAVQELTKHASVGLRFEHYEPSADALELFGGMTVVTRRRFRTLTSALSANLPLEGGARARLLLEYEYQKNSLGRDNQGLPAQLDNDTLRLRMEMAF